MSVPYERYNDDIEAAEQSSLSSDEGAVSTPTARPDVVILQRNRRQQEIFRDRWPKRIGTVQLIVGFLCSILAIINIIVLPFILKTNSEHPVQLNATNVWGVGIWAGLLLIITGSLGLRSAMYNSVTTIYIFFGCILVDILAFIAFMLMIVIGFGDLIYALGKGGLGSETPFAATQLAVDVIVIAGFVLVLVAFTQYYEEVFCGELQCLRRACHCCLPCWCPRVVEPEELMSEEGRPPSLPV